MNISSHYPWPVLGDNDAVSGTFSSFSQVDLGRDEITIRGNFVLDNETIQSLIFDGKADYMLQITCVATHLRKCYSFSKSQFEVILPAVDLRGIVRMDYYVIATKELPEYQNSTAHPDYGGAIVSIGRGDVLAEAQPEKFDAMKRYAGTKTVSDFLEIVRDQSLIGPMIVEPSQDKVLVRLPSPDFDKLSIFANSKTERVNSIIQSSVAFPALLIALQYAFEDPGFYERFLWFNVLKERSEKTGIEWTKENISEIAQEILKKPVGRMLSGLKNIVESADSSE